MDTTQSMPASPSRWTDPSTLTIVGLLVVTWLGIHASWGLTDPGDTQLSAPMRTLAAIETWLLGAVVVLAGEVAMAWHRHRGVAWVAAMLLAFLGGTWLAGVVDSQVSVAGSVSVRRFVERSVQLLPALPMLVVWWCTPGAPRALRRGSWDRQTSTVGTGRSTWRRLLAGWLVVVALPAALVMQAQVGFVPVLTGAAWPLLAPLAALALLNGFLEELLFRGLLQASLVAALGPTIGVWLQAGFFGIHHWGAGPAAAGGIPIVVVTACLGVLWGRSVLETKGLGWAVCAHASLVLAFFLVQFVPIP